VSKPPSTRGSASADLPAVLALVDRLQPAIARGDRAEQNAIIGQLIDRRAAMGDQWQQLALLALGNGEIGLARKAIDLLGEALGGDHAAHYHKAALIALLGDWREADALLRSLPETVPDPAANAYSRGMTALNLGAPEDARPHLERATRLRPQAGRAWLALSMAVDFAREPDMADHVIAAEQHLRYAAAAEQAPYYHALGKAHAERGDPALAFEAFAQGARLAKSAMSHDRDQDRAGAAAATDGYSAERIAAIAREQREPTSRTIFVTGLPRSGTTLVEQILTSHSAVSHGAEIGRLALLAQEVGGPSHPALARHIAAHGAGPAARLWDHWLDELFPASRRIVDKTVDASRFLGLVAALLPEAPLIWVTRDALDRAWSCFRTNFSGNAMAWSYDLEDIAAHFRLEDALLAQWKAILGERLLVVPYEALVADPPAWTGRLLAHCGLAHEPQVLAPHENRRAVATASMVQVRRPIHGAAVGAAEPYRAFLEPFIAAYYG
jgi:tetratricopeptide (TPR) repeat protein